MTPLRQPPHPTLPVLAALLVVACGSPTRPDQTADPMMTNEPTALFDFSDTETAQRFTAVDDRVMGGVSQSALSAVGGSAVFAGELSTEQNGGFASVRSTPLSVDLSAFEGIALYVRGDGRTYKLRMRTDDRFNGVSYQAPFATTAGVWTTLKLPFQSFEPTYRGRVPPDAAPLDPAAVRSFGLLVAGEQVGAFQLELRWIRPCGQR